MGLRDHAIVGFAETKVMEKSDRNVWVLAGEILEALLDKTGVEKDEIDGLVMAGLTGTGAGATTIPAYAAYLDQWGDWISPWNAPAEAASASA